MASGEVGSAHVSLELHMQQYQRELNAARAATQRAAQQMQGNLTRVNQAGQSLNRTMIRVSGSVQRASRQFLALRAAAGSAVAAMGARAAIQAADAWVLLGARLRLVTDSAEGAAAAQEKLFQLAQRSRAPLEEVATLFVRLRAATDELGVSEEQALRVTESLSKLLVISGVNAQESAAALTQLTQSFQRGVIRGDELRSLFESFPALLRLMADDAGMTDRAFAKMALESGISVDRMVNATIRAAGQIDKSFSQIPTTVDQSITKIRNSLLRSIGVSAEASGLYDSLAEALAALDKVAGSPGFQKLLTVLFYLVSLPVEDFTSRIEQLSHALNILDLASKGDFGALWEQYLTKGKEAEEQTKAVGEAVKAIAESGIDEELAAMLEKLTNNIKELRNEASIAALEAYQLAGALDMIRVAFKGQDVGNIAPQSMISALEELATAGFDVTRNFSDWPATIQKTFQSLVMQEEATRRVTAQIETQADALKQLKDAHLEYQRSRVQGEGIDAQIERDEEAFEAWKRIQEEKQREEEQYQQRIAEGGRLPDEIDAATIAAQGLASALTDLESLSFDSVAEGIAGIGRQLAEAVIQAMIFRAIMGAAGGGFAPIFGGASDVTRMARGGFITNRPMIMPMQTGGALIGEAGPEAVLPLKRMASGNLGVASERGGGDDRPNIYVDARQSTPGTAAAAVREAVRLAPGAIVNAQSRGQMGRGKHPF